jgi:hypothetical protein
MQGPSTIVFFPECGSRIARGNSNEGDVIEIARLFVFQFRKKPFVFNQIEQARLL